ncbi:MAG: hypothetical protein AB7U40_06075 [Methanobacteriales archaeon]
MTTYILREFLPGIGNMNIVLYGKAARLYRCLREEFFERLKKVEQLGVISQVEISASHTRWEYMIFQLYLIQKLFKEKGKRSLGNLELGGTKLSGVELLQLWVFLFNIGHLPGTFATMRGLLLAMEKNNELKKELKKEIPDKLKNHFDEVIERRDIFELPKFLSAILLNDLKKEEKRKNENDCSKVLNDFLFDLILCYISPDNCQDNREKIEKLMLYFRMIRRLAYIFLDSKHVSSPISFDVSEIILSFDNYKKLLMEPRSQLDKTLEACEDFLSITLYHSKDTISQLGRHAKKTEEIFEKYENSSFKDFLNKKSNKFYSKYYTPASSFHVLLDLSQYEDKLEKLDKFFYGLEKELNEKYFEKKSNNSSKSSERALLTYQPGSNKKHIAINFSIYKEEKLWEPIEDFTFHILEKIEDSKEFKDKKWMAELFKEQVYPQFFKFLLKLIFKRYSLKDLYFDNGQITAGKFNTLKNRIEKWKKETKESSKLHELKTLENAIKKEKIEKGYGIIGYNIEVKDQNIMEVIAQFDGIILFFKKNNSKINSEMLFLEAKKEKKGGEKKGAEQLEEALKKIFKIKLPIKTGRISSKGRYACCKVAINKEGFIGTDRNNQGG